MAPGRLADLTPGSPSRLRDGVAWPAPRSLPARCAASRHASTTSSTYTKSRAVCGLTSGGKTPRRPCTINDGSRRRGSSNGPYALYSRSVLILVAATDEVSAVGLPKRAAVTHIAVALALVLP